MVFSENLSSVFRTIQENYLEMSACKDLTGIRPT